MKEIIINKDNILDKDVNNTNNINNYIFIYNNKLLLKKHHNSYYFIHEEDINNDYKINPFLIKKIYETDYPFIGDNTLFIKNFYLIKEKIDIQSTEWLELNNINKILEDTIYNNPRVQDITKEIIEVINYLLTIIN